MRIPPLAKLRARIQGEGPLPRVEFCLRKERQSTHYSAQRIQNEVSVKHTRFIFHEEMC